MAWHKSLIYPWTVIFQFVNVYRLVTLAYPGCQGNSYGISSKLNTTSTTNHVVRFQRRWSGLLQEGVCRHWLGGEGFLLYRNVDVWWCLLVYGSVYGSVKAIQSIHTINISWHIHHPTGYNRSTYLWPMRLAEPIFRKEHESNWIDVKYHQLVVHSVA